MEMSRKLRILIGASIAAGALLLSGVASAGTQVGASVSVSLSETAVVTSSEKHVCTYEQRPVTRTYSDSSGGSYEHRTYETVRVCTHERVYTPELASEIVYKEKRPKARKVRRKNRHTNYSVGVGYYGGSPSLHGGLHYGYYGHHYPRSSFSLSLGFGGLHHGYGHHGHH